MSNSEKIRTNTSPSRVFKRVRTPTLIQMEATECGAVALGIIMGYYGKYVSIEELRSTCGVSRDGSNALKMTEAAEKYGLEAKGYSLELEDLYQLEFPVILFWKFEHFVVLEGFDKAKVYINDPATGPRTISYEDLDQSFTGVVLTFKLTEAFVKSGKPSSLFESLYERSKQVKMPLLYVALVGICMLVPNLALPAFTQVFIDQVLINHALTWQKGIIVGMILAMVAGASLTYLQGKVLNRLHARLSMRYSSDSFWHMLRLPMSFYTQRYPGEIAYRLGINETISQTITGSMATTLLNILFIFIYGIAIFYYDVVIATIALVMIVLNFFLLRYVYRIRQDAYARYQSDYGKSTAFSLGGLKNIETIKASGMESKFFSNWAGYYTKIVNTLQDVGKKDIFLAVLTPLLNSMTTFALIGIGVWRIINGHLTVGMFIALQILLRYLTAPVMQLMAFSQSFQLLKVDIARIDDILKSPLDPLFLAKIDSKPQQPHTKLEGNVDLHDVTFGYNLLAPPILTNISLSMRPGKSVALVGPTGCGKSSTAKIIAGLLYPWSGQILFDGQLRSEIERQRITHSLSLVEQEPFLFNATVKENLTMLDPLADQEEMIRATKDACIHDEILARAGGYDLEIEENGGNLSVGQMQRIEIARALIKNPSILIMDEATSAVDSVTESKIYKNIRRRGCALLIIAHRLSTIRNCDEILVLDKGKIVASGTHESLKAQGGIYQNLIESEYSQ